MINSKTIKKTVASALSFALIASSAAMINTEAAFAATETDNFNVGSSILTTSAYNGTKVYYGQYNGSPVIYNVLNADGNSALLNSETTLFDMPFSGSSKNPNQEAKNAWPGSNIQILLNGDEFYANANVFSSAEKNAILSTEHQAETYTTSNKDYETTDNVFLLSINEANNYYSSDNDSKIKTDSQGQATKWWLRTSPTAAFLQAHGRAISDNGALVSQVLTNDNVGVSPAFNIDLSKVAFVTSPTADKEALSAVTSDSSSTWELTLTASNSTLEATATAEGNNITINHKAASDVLGDATQVSAAVFDKDNNLLYYGAVNTDESATTSQFQLPDGLTTENTSIYVFAEDVNDQAGSDYISALGNPLTYANDEEDSDVSTDDNTGNVSGDNNSSSDNNDSAVNNDSQNSNAATSESTDNKSMGSDKGSNKVSKNDPVKTSDDFAMAAALTLLVAGGAGCAALLKKKYIK